MNINKLAGKTLTSIKNIHNDEIIFQTISGDKYKLYHDQECCESVSIEEIHGDLEDLVGHPIIKAEKRTKSKQIDDVDVDHVSCTWTFYELATIKGSVTIRWYGSSNGWYSTGVSFDKVEEEHEET